MLSAEVRHEIEFAAKSRGRTVRGSIGRRASHWFVRNDLLRMPKELLDDLMLASVTGVEEAEIAIRHGADIVDLKDVSSDFGAVAPELVRATVDAVARRRPVSAVISEPEMAPAIVARAAAAIADAGANYVKVGLFPGHAAGRLRPRPVVVGASRQPDRRHVR